MKRMRVAVAGLRRGETFLRVLRTMPDVDVIGLADPDRERRIHARALLPAGSNADEADSLASLLDTDPPPDLVVLATPPIGRVADAVAALERGIHVLSEIPAAWSVEECEQLLSAAEASTGTYMLAENALYWGFVDAARSCATPPARRPGGSSAPTRSRTARTASVRCSRSPVSTRPR